MMLHVLIRQVVGTNIQKTSSIQIKSVEVLALVLSSVLFIPEKMGIIYRTVIALNSLLVWMHVFEAYAISIPELSFFKKNDRKCLYSNVITLILSKPLNLLYVHFTLGSCFSFLLNGDTLESFSHTQKQQTCSSMWFNIEATDVYKVGGDGLLSYFTPCIIKLFGHICDT